MENNNVLTVSLEQGLAADALDKSTVEQVFSPEEVEAKLVSEEKKRLDDFMENEEQISLMTIKILTPQFRDAVNKLGSRATKRVLKSIVEYPLHDYTHNDKDEKVAVHLGKTLTDAKLVLMYHTYNQNKDKIIDMALKDAVKNAEFQFGDQAVNNEVQEKEVTNG